MVALPGGSHMNTVLAFCPVGCSLCTIFSVRRAHPTGRRAGEECIVQQCHSSPAEAENARTRNERSEAQR